MTTLTVDVNRGGICRVTPLLTLVFVITLLTQSASTMSVPGSLITFEHDFDISDPSLEQSLAAILTGTPDAPKMSDATLRDGLKFWREHLPQKWRLIARADGMVPVPHSNGGMHNFPILGIVGIGAACEKLRHCVNFQTIVKSLHSHDEFGSTLFTIQAAQLCHSQPTVSEFEFGPAIVARGGFKRPDFAFKSAIGPVVCECKDMQSMQRVESFPEQAVLRAFEQAILAVEIPQDLRPEVKFASRPNHNLQRFASQVAAGLQELGRRRAPNIVKMNFRDTGRSVTVCLTDRRSPPRLTGSRNWIGNISPGLSFPESVQNAPVLLVVDKDDATSIGRQIREANQQLPTHGHTLIFVNPIHGPSTNDAAERRIHEPSYSNLLGIFFRKGDNWQLIGLNNCGPYLKQLFPTIFPEHA